MQICRADGRKWKLEPRQCDSIAYDLNYASLLSCEWPAQTHNCESLNCFVHKHSVQADVQTKEQEYTPGNGEYASRYSSSSCFPKYVAFIHSFHSWQYYSESLS